MRTNTLIPGLGEHFVCLRDCSIPLLCLLLFALGGGQVAMAVTLEPMVLAVDIHHASRAQITLTNTSTASMPVEVSPRRIHFYDDDKYVISDETDPPFLVFPPAAVIEPGQSQVFRLQWLGGELLSGSVSYFVRFTRIQLKPAVPEDDQSGIRVQIHYNSLVHFFTRTQQPSVVFNVDAPGMATLINQGDRYAYLSRFRFICSSGEKPQSGHRPQIDDLSHQIGERFLPPGRKMQIEIPETILPCHYAGVAEYDGELR